MGCILSKGSDESPSIQIVLVTNGSSNGAASNIQYKAELFSYYKACQNEPEIRSFDSNLQQRTARVVTIVGRDAESSDHHIRALSFDSLREVAGCFFDTNQEVVDILLKSKEDIWKNPELFDLVKEYFESSKQTLDFCAALQRCLTRATNTTVIAQLAVQFFKEEQEAVENRVVGESKSKYQRTLDELQRIKEAGDPFDDEFSNVFDAVCNQQKSMLRKMLRQTAKLDKKARSMESWKKVSSVIFISAVSAILICSIVTAAIAAPPVAAALVAAVSTPVGSAGTWINHLWKGYENAVKEQKDVIDAMQTRCKVVIADLEGIKHLIDNTKIQIETMMHAANFANRGDEAVRFGVDEIKEKLDLFMKNIDELQQRADHCSGNTTKARAAVLQKILKTDSEK